MTSSRTFRTELAGRPLTFEVGKLAGQADASVTVRYGDTVVLGACLMANPRPGTDFMPLLVEYEEKFYAAGKIKGSRFMKREGKPTDIAIITSRLIDRSIRPLFPKGMRDDVQVVTTVLSYDDAHEADIVAMLAASAALAISRIPWNGPIGAVRIGRTKDGAWLVNPTSKEVDQAMLDLVVAGTASDVVMLEAGATEIAEADLLAAIDQGMRMTRELAAFIEAMRKDVGQKKADPHTVEFPSDLEEAVRASAQRELPALLQAGGSKVQLNARVEEWTEHLVTEQGTTADRAAAVRALCQDMHRDLVREWILKERKRVDGRQPNEIRPLSVEVGVLPRTHGSALFQRGETQVLSVTTLGAPDDIMILDTMTEEDTKKHFFHFYNMPGFSVGEIKPNRGAGRRDIGHGMLAERAVAPLLPSRDVFPYTVMVVSEVLSSNGSSSMGSACGTSLALMDAGVPVPRHVAGIAMGLVTDETGQGRAPVLLTDIAGMEDEGCDMDFKVAGTRQGVTALQVDIKIPGLPRPLVEEALMGARTAREQILGVMERALPSPRAELSRYAPRIVSFRINPEKIRDVIGPRGTVINKIIEETGTDITVEDDGQVSITSTDAAGIEKATTWIKNLTREIVAGEEFPAARVTRLMNFGAFVELIPGTDGLVHISEFGQGFVRNIEDVVALGDALDVVVKEVDHLGRINLSLKNRPQGTPTPEQFSADTEQGAFDRPVQPFGRGGSRRPPSLGRGSAPRRSGHR
ncbi:MAG: polyribonucleotide nucleotidyltransferase [Parcubacteria group bacterium Gr01-1014_106]|nr:MAG: polyribonucleotide nucleotidyltransferase [Parcubacteria group bacterium Gr01-1014_106]